MSSFIKRILRRNTARDASLDYITTSGFFGDQWNALDALFGSEGDFLDNFENFCKNFIPFANARKDKHMAEMMRRWLENYELLVEIKYELKLIEHVENKKRDKAELQFTKHQVEKILRTDAMIVLAQTFDKPEYKTIVLDKPYILGDRGGPGVEATSGKRISGEGKRKGFPSELSSEVE